MDESRGLFRSTPDAENTFAAESEEGASPGDLSRFDAASAYLVVSGSDPPPDAGWLRRFYGRAFRHGAYLVLEWNGAYRNRARAEGREIEASGGTTLSISPGLQYFVSDRLLLELSLPIPVVTAHEVVNDAIGGVRFAAVW